MTAPFGIDLNAPLPAALAGGDRGGGKCEVKPPRPHPAFHLYLAETSPAFGVVWLKGIGPTAENDRYGSAVQRSFVEVSTQLTSRYGPPRAVDILKAGAIWTEPREWVSSIFNQERILFQIWERPAVPDLPDDLASIFLGVTAYSSDESAIILEYASSRQADAEKEQQNNLADLL